MTKTIDATEMKDGGGEVLLERPLGQSYGCWLEGKEEKRESSRFKHRMKPRSTRLREGRFCTCLAWDPGAGPERAHKAIRRLAAWNCLSWV